jgi:hypothetical protein
VEFSTLPRLVGPIEVKFDSKRRAGHQAQEFQGWPVALINHHFLVLNDKNGGLNMHEMSLWRRALLCSYEVNCIAERERFSV